MYSSSIKQRIRKQYLIHAIIPLLATIGLFIMFTPIGFKGALILINRREARTITNNLATTLESYKAEAKALATMPETTALLLHPEYPDNAKNMFTRFYAFTAQQTIRSTLVILGSTGNLVLTSSAREPSFAQILALRNMESRIQRTKDDILGEALYLKLGIDMESVYTIGCVIKNDGAVIGHAFFLLHKDDILNELFATGVSITVLVDEFDTVIATTNSSITQAWNKFRPEGKFEGRIDGNHTVGPNTFLMVRKNVPFSRLSVYCLSTLNPQTPLILLMLAFVMMIMIISYLLIRRMGNNIAIKTTEPVDRLRVAIDAFQHGDMESYVSIDSDDEFQLLGDQYNLMLKRINALIQRNTELQEIRRISELKLLESQFNPHFMFNILECIRYLIIMDPGKAQETVLSLSELLRYSVRDMNELVPLSEDLEYMHNFLALHKVRVGDRLDYEINLQNGMEDILVPRLIIQPLVENSVKYGFQTQMDLHIRITGRIDRERDTIEFTVADDGGGMDDHLLNSIREMIDSKGTHISRSGIGIYNLYRRIELLFSGEGSLAIENRDNGLRATVVIPAGGI